MRAIECVLIGTVLVACENTAGGTFVPHAAGGHTLLGGWPSAGGASAGAAGWIAASRPGAGAVQSGVGEVAVPASTPVPAGSMPDVMAAAWCEGLQTCCNAWSLEFDLTRCMDTIRAMMAERLAEPLAVRYDPEAAGQCVAKIRAGYEACRLLDAAPCQRILAPTLPPGVSCQSDEECAPPPEGHANCYPVNILTPEAAGGAGGATVVVASGGVGGLAGAVNAGTLDSTPKICVANPGAPHGALGDPCVRTCLIAPSGDGGCLEDNSFYSMSGQTPPVPSQGCWEEDGLYCDPRTVTCQQLLPTGSPCTYSTNCQTGSYCLEGVCTPLGPAGAACGIDRPCATGLYCTCSVFCSETQTGVCAPLTREGEPCDDPDQCIGYCRQQATEDSRVFGMCVAGNSFVPDADLCSTYTFSST